MLIRLYLAADFAALLRMSLALFTDATAYEHERDLRVILAREDAALFIAFRDDGSAAGFVEVSTRPYVDGCDTSPVGFIEAWYVDPDVRRTGVGRALLSAAEEWARERGYQEMGSDALLDNTVSHRAHEANGYIEVDRNVQYRKPLRSSIVSDIVRREVERRLGPERARDFITRLGATTLPMLDAPDMTRDRDRVHLGILKLAEHELGRLDYHLDVASRDWRDTLVAAGLGNANWPDVLRAEGFPSI